MKESDIAYIAGLFDGEGSIHYKKSPEKKKKHKGKPGYRMSNSWRISMEVTMTDPMVINWLKETLKTGTVTKKPRKGLRKDGSKYLMQYLETLIMFVVYSIRTQLRSLKKLNRF